MTDGFRPVGGPGRRAILGGLLAPFLALIPGVQTSAKQGFSALFDRIPLIFDRNRPESGSFHPTLTARFELRRDFELLTRRIRVGGIDGPLISKERVLDAMRPEIKRQLGPLAASFEDELRSWGA